VVEEPVVPVVEEPVVPVVEEPVVPVVEEPVVPVVEEPVVPVIGEPVVPMVEEPVEETNNTIITPATGKTNLVTTTEVNPLGNGMNEIIIKIKVPENARTNLSKSGDNFESTMSELMKGGKKGIKYNKTKRNYIKQSSKNKTGKKYKHTRRRKVIIKK